VPAIIEYTRTDDKGLGSTAHEILKEISTKHPRVFSTHVKDLCKTLESEAPTEKAPNPPGAVDDLKALASFAKKFPEEVPLNAKDGRKLVQGLLSFALFGTPPKAAKHAITIIMSSDGKKELHAKEILRKSLKDFEYACGHWLTKLAALSQLVLLAPQECEDEIDSVVAVAVENVLLKTHPSSSGTEEEWMETPDEDLIARTWALRILVNRLISCPDDTNLIEHSTPVFKLLNRMVKENGEASKKGSTPLAHKNRQRLLAANFLLKLATQRRLEGQITPIDFNHLALVTHDSCFHVRKGFALKLMKYLGQNRLPTRYFSILFLFAHEPDVGLRDILATWIRSRRAAFTFRKETVLETSVFARLLSLLAHHPDLSYEEDTLKQMATYILFYLKCVATEDNLALIYHMAGRVKTVKDGVQSSKEADDKLYTMSDLAQAVILLWEDTNNWSMQSFPGKQKLPSGIFKPLESHERGQEIAQKQYINKDFADVLEPLVRKAIRSKKRKAGDGIENPRKKTKNELKKDKPKSERTIKTPRKKRKGSYSDDEEGIDSAVAPSSGPRRKSGRKSMISKSYVEVSSDEEVDAEVGAQEELSNAESGATGDDVSMEEPEILPTGQDETQFSEDESQPGRPKRTTRSKISQTTDGIAISLIAQQRKTLRSIGKPPAPSTSKAPSVTKGKTRVNGANGMSSSSPVTNGTAVRRSGRNRD